ncbi:MAG: DNA polymerase III subunit chi [Alphaproteobacteria bacterium]|nr:DNA polymerase III subunit chi [Alphaproteobacteria bacterium]
MAEAFFYHLTRSRPEAAIAMLIEKSLARGWRVAVRAPDGAVAEALDRALWLQGGDDGFVPHGRAGGPHDADQPALILAGGALPEGRACLILAEGAGADPAEVAGVARACLVFDGADPAALEAARGAWRRLRAAGIETQYWNETSGRWERQGAG